MAVVIGVDDPAASGGEADVPGVGNRAGIARDEQQVAGLDLVQARYRRAVVDLGGGGAPDRDAGGGPGGLHEPGAIEGVGAGCAPHIRFACAVRRSVCTPDAVGRNSEGGSWVTWLTWR